MTKKPSQNHRNRQWHNWLVYDLNDQYLLDCSDLYQGTLYDLGCGESPYRDLFLQSAEHYIGVDWEGSPHATKETILADLNQPLAIEDNVADTIVTLSVMEHLHNPQMMLDEAYRILKPHGNIVLQVPWQWWIHEAPHDYFRFTPYALKFMFEKSGFNNIEITPQGGFFTMWILKFNYFTTRFVGGPTRLRQLIKLCLSPFWYLGQKSAPLLDWLDKHWHKETIGFVVTANKK
jgi:SAM-dependent methyltransferase